ncbi:MAG: hypothetical protein MZV64_23690 [Ignavibacteriales bacterium]|nr:hypothetical protein [Ignavibacteriales bacterium]
MLVPDHRRLGRSVTIFIPSFYDETPFSAADRECTGGVRSTGRADPGCPHERRRKRYGRLPDP